MPYSISLIASITAIAFCEWHTDEDMLTLAIIFGASFLVGALRPGLFVLSAITLGLVVPATNLVSFLTGILPRYVDQTQWVVHGFGYIIGLSLLIVPALLGTFCGRVCALCLSNRQCRADSA